MPIYGRSKQPFENGLHEMSEISLKFSLSDLRRIARFLNNFADEVEAGTIRAHHDHLTSFDPAWNSDHPHCDVIVFHPSPTPPRRVE